MTYFRQFVTGVQKMSKIAIYYEQGDISIESVIKSVFCGNGDVMKKKFCNVVIGVICCCLLAGCSVREEEVFADSLPEIVEESTEVPEVNRIGIYADVTPSMKGFLGMSTESYQRIVKETRYKLCLYEIDNIISAQYDPDQITYYRIDTPLWRTDENVLQEARSGSYYQNSSMLNKGYEKIDLIEDDGEEYDSYCLANALQHCVNDDLAIIVTDLYENEAAASEVIRAMKQNMVSGSAEERVVGIVGIRSEFAGKIYDLGVDTPEVEYGMVDGEVTEDDIVYRQFYVVAIGAPQIVQEFCSHLMEKMNLSTGDMEYVVFYENEVYGLDYSDFFQCYSRGNQSGNKLWPKSSISLNGTKSMDVFDYDNDTGVEKDVVVSYSMDSVSLKTECETGTATTITLPDLPEKTLIEIPFVVEGQETAAWKQENAGFEQKENLKNIFSIEGVFYSPDEELLYVWFKIEDGDLPHTVLRLRSQIKLLDKAEQVGAWCEEWNLANGEEAEACWKTKNLKEYFSQLTEQMPQRNRQILDFVFYIKGL